MDVRKRKRVERCWRTVHGLAVSWFTGERTHLDPRNHLSVPRRSESDLIASRYWEIMAEWLMRTALGVGGMKER